jgi:hypothetical protein
LIRCLDSLAQQEPTATFEIIVAGCPGELRSRLQPLYPEVQFPDPGKHCLPVLLKKAIDLARGFIVLMTDARCVFTTDWIQKIVRAHDSQYEVIGGAVAHAGSNSALAWACYLADYAAFMPLALRHETPLLAGNHVSYKRALLIRVRDLLDEGYWKVFLHKSLEQQGRKFLFDPDLVIFCVQEEAFWDFINGYFQNAAQFAAMRGRSLSISARITHVITAPLLPFVLFLRRVKSIWRNKRQCKKLVSAIPFLAAFVFSWSAGELAGYLRGETVLKTDFP